MEHRPPVIDLFGGAYRPATAQIPGINAVIHTGDPGTFNLSVSNTDPADTLSESLIAQLTGATTGISLDAAGPTADITPGQTNATLSVQVATKQAATINDSATVALTTDGGTGAGSVDGLGPLSLGAQDVPVAVTVDNYANPAFEKLSGAGTLTRSGNAYTLDLGTVMQGSGPVSAALGVLNDVSGPADLLTGSFGVTGSSAFSNGGLDALPSLSAGQADTAPFVSLDTSAGGHFSETITLIGTGSNASGYSAALPDTTLTIEGDVAVAGQTYVLTTSPDTVAGGPGADTVIAASRTLSAGDQIDGGGGPNTLALTGAGSFDLRAPATLAGIETITAQEGQPATSVNGRSVAAQNQIVILRDGLDATVQVSPDPSLDPANPKPATITIVAGHNADVIHLASGNDVVTLQDARQTLTGGTGNDTIIVDASSIGASIDGGSGHSTLDVTGGGTVVMGGSVPHVVTALLSAATTRYDFTANAIAGLLVDDASTGADTLRAGGALQTLTGGGAGTTMIGSLAGNDTFKGTAAGLNGDTIANFAATGDQIDLTDVQFASLQTPEYLQFGAGPGMLTVTDGTHTAAIALSGLAATTGFHAADDGAAGTALSMVDPPALRFTDVTTNTVGTAQTSAYSGPVSYLQSQ